MEKFVISTPGDNKRYERLVHELKTQGLELNKDVQIFPAFMDRTMARRGILRSHKSIVLHAKQKGLPEIMIMEDDIRFLSPNSMEIFLNVNKLIPKNCDMLMAGLYDGIIDKCYSKYAAVDGKISGLHCYIVKEKFYDRFIGADEDYNLDYVLSAVIKATIYTAYPMLALQYDGYSYNTMKDQVYNYNIHKKYKLHNDGE